MIVLPNCEYFGWNFLPRISLSPWYYFRFTFTLKQTNECHLAASFSASCHAPAAWNMFWGFVGGVALGLTCKHCPSCKKSPSVICICHIACMQKRFESFVAELQGCMFAERLNLCFCLVVTTGEQSKQLQMYCMHDLETGERGRLGGFKHLRGQRTCVQEIMLYPSLWRRARQCYQPGSHSALRGGSLTLPCSCGIFLTRSPGK